MIGVWTDQRTIYVFQKLALSSDEDAGAENVYRLLLHSGMVAGGDEGNLLGGQGYHEGAFTLDIPIDLYDNGPWNRLYVTMHVYSLSVNSSVRLLKADPGTGFTVIATFTDTVVAPGQRVTFTVDISGLAVGIHEYILQVLDDGTASNARWYGLTASLFSTVTGLVV